MNSLVINGTATKQPWHKFDGQPAVPAYVVTLVIPVDELVAIIDARDADAAVTSLGQAILEEIRLLEGEIART